MARIRYIWRLFADRRDGTKISINGRLAAVLMVFAIIGWPPGAAAQDGTTTKFQDWLVTCPAGNPCIATYQTRGLRILIGRSRTTKALRATMFVSNEAVQGAPVSIWLDIGLTIELLVSVCKDRYCEAGVAEDKTATVLSALKRSDVAVAAYGVGDRILMVPISLKGSTAAIKAIGG